jgi:hypothetical protein
MRENDYYQHTLELLEDSYVAADERGDLAGGSGSGGGLERWRRKRKVIAAAFDHDGTWLDAGCANGLLMETLSGWAADRDVRVEPYGLELSTASCATGAASPCAMGRTDLDRERDDLDAADAF